MSTLLIQRYRGGDLVDGFELSSKDGSDMDSMFEWAKRLPCVVPILEEGALVLDLKEGCDILQDPVTIKADSADWYLYEFMKLNRRNVGRLISESRKQESRA